MSDETPKEIDFKRLEESSDVFWKSAGQHCIRGERSSLTGCIPNDPDYRSRYRGRRGRLHPPRINPVYRVPAQAIRERGQEQVSKIGKGGEYDPKFDELGGVIPIDLDRAKRIDLITLPENIEGVNCGNCHFAQKDGDVLFCNNENVLMKVNERQCCILWNHEEAYRAWVGQEQEEEKSEKSLSWLSESSGGALVAPPAVKDSTTVEEVGKRLADDWANLEKKYSRRKALAKAIASLLRNKFANENIKAIAKEAERIRGLQGCFSGKKSLVGYPIKMRGQPCIKGERADKTGCIPKAPKIGKRKQGGGSPNPQVDTWADLAVMVEDTLEKLSELIKTNEHFQESLKNWQEIEEEKEIIQGYPELIQQALKNVYLLSRSGSKELVNIIKESRQAAFGICRTRGASESDCGKFVNTLSAINVKTYKSIDGDMRATVKLKFKSKIPVGAANYLINSTSSEPLETAKKAATKANTVYKLLSEDKSKETETVNPQNYQNDKMELAAQEASIPLAHYEVQEPEDSPSTTKPSKSKKEDNVLKYGPSRVLQGPKIRSKKKSLPEESDNGSADLLERVYDFVIEDDWKYALFMISLDRTEDVEEALELAINASEYEKDKDVDIQD